MPGRPLDRGSDPPLADADVGSRPAVVTLLVTFVFNITLKNALATGGARAAFERSWVHGVLRLFVARTSAR